MGDFNLTVKMNLTGIDGKEYKRYISVNWWPNKPEEIYKILVDLANEAGLEVDDDAYLFDAIDD